MTAPKPIGVELRALLTLALPLVAARVGHNLMGVVDTVMAGRIDETAQAIVGLGTTFYFGGLILAIATLLGLDPVTSQAVGGNRPETYRATLATGRWLAVAFSVPTIALQLGIPWVFYVGGYDATLARDAGVYSAAAAVGTPAALLYQVVSVYLTAHGHTRPFFWIMLAANGLNLLLNTWFVHGGLGLAPMGTVGLALSTAIGAWFQLACGLWLLRETGPFRALRSRWSWHPDVARRVLRLGVPVGVQFSLEMGAFSLVTVLMGAFGAAVLAAHQVAINLAAMMFVVAIAIGNAGSVRVGQAVGRRDVEGAIVAGRAALVVGVGWAVLAAAVLLGFREPIARFYTPTATDVSVAVSLLGIAAWFQLADSTQAVGFGVLRGLSDTRVPALFNILGYWVFGIPIGAYVAFRYDAPTALWWGLTAALVLVAGAILWRWARWRIRLREQGVPC